MSNPADKTQYRALSIIAKMVKEFERLHYLDMTKTDDEDACKARNLLQGIVQSNGYKINYSNKIKRSLLKDTDNGK